jgi:DNA-binding IclR family transcriptional regulator
LGLDKPTATRILQALQRKGWVEMLPYPDHGRKLRLGLSHEGQALVARLLAFRKTIREGLEQGLDDEKRKAVRVGDIQKQVQLLGQLPPATRIRIFPASASEAASSCWSQQPPSVRSGLCSVRVCATRLGD